MSAEGVVAVSRTYTASATREGRWWIVTVDGIGVTQSRTLRDAETSARGLVSAVLDVDEGDIAVVVKAQLDAELLQTVTAARQAVADLEEFQRQAGAASRDATARLIAAGLTGADAATVLGISPQRVSQLTTAALGGPVLTEREVTGSSSGLELTVEDVTHGTTTRDVEGPAGGGGVEVLHKS